MEKIYKLNRHTFFKWYFSEPNKNEISAFIAPKLLNLVKEDVKFGLTDILASLPTIPVKLLTHYTGKETTISTTNVELTK
jgi:hypothetical protein